MRIGINASFLRKPNTGIGQVTLHFLKTIVESAHVDFIVYLEEPLRADIEIPKHFKQRVLRTPWGRDDLIRKVWWERRTLPVAVKRDGCDAFISMYQSATILPRTIRHLMVVHDIIPGLFSEYLNNFRKRFYWECIERAIGRADRIFTVSSRTEKDLIQSLGILPSKITVNRIDVDPIFKRKVTPKQSAETLLKYKLSPGYLYTGGGLEVRKNVEGTLIAYRKLLDRAKSDHNFGTVPPLVISGTLMPELAPLVTDVERRVRELDLTPYVHLLGFVSQKDLPALYANAICFLFPSRYEGFGLPVLEAMSVGTPVVTAKGSSLPEVGKDAVLYCNPDDPDDIAMVIRNILSNKNLREILGKRGKERSEHFSWKRFTGKLIHVATGEKQL